MNEFCLKRRFGSLFLKAIKAIYMRGSWLCQQQLTISSVAAYTRGKPTRFAPRPKPAPWRAVTAIEGVKVSRTANVAKAAVPIVRISPKLGFLGFRTSTATKATTRPSIRYFRTDVKRSPREKSILILVP